jgi:hypothetical protein
VGVGGSASAVAAHGAGRSVGWTNGSTPPNWADPRVLVKVGFGA